MRDATLYDLETYMIGVSIVPLGCEDYPDGNLSQEQDLQEEEKYQNIKKNAFLHWLNQTSCASHSFGNVPEATQHSLADSSIFGDKLRVRVHFCNLIRVLGVAIVNIHFDTTICSFVSSYFCHLQR